MKTSAKFLHPFVRAPQSYSFAKIIGDFSASSFDAVIAIESFYQCKDLTPRSASSTSSCVRVAKWHFFYASTADGPRDRLSATNGKLGAALRANGIVFNVFDLSESDRHFWMRLKIVAEEMRAEFEAEGNADLIHLDETEARLNLIQEGREACYKGCVAWILRFLKFTDRLELVEYASSRTTAELHS